MARPMRATFTDTPVATTVRTPRLRRSMSRAVPVNGDTPWRRDDTKSPSSGPSSGTTAAASEPATSRGGPLASAAEGEQLRQAAQQLLDLAGAGQEDRKLGPGGVVHVLPVLHLNLGQPQRRQLVGQGRPLGCGEVPHQALEGGGAGCRLWMGAAHVTDVLDG